MTITISDPVLLAQLQGVKDRVDFRAPDGQYLGNFEVPYGVPPKGYVPPITDPEIEQRRQTYRDGISTAEALKRIQDEKRH